MAVTVVGAGAFASGVGAISPALPTGWAADDLHVLVVETASQAVTTPSGWNIPANVPAANGAAGGTTSTQLSVFWRRAVAGDAAPSVADSGDHQGAFVVGLRGIDWTNGPFDITAGDTGASSTSVTFPGVTTTVDNAYLLMVVANATDTATAQGSATVTNAALTGLTQIANGNTTSGNGGGLSVYGGTKATAGATGTTSTTLTTASVQARMTLAIRPYVAPPVSGESLFYPSTTPPSFTHNDVGGSGIAQGTELYFTSAGQVSAIAFWWANETGVAATSGTVGLYDDSGTLLASKAFSGLTGSGGWQVITLDTPVSVSANARYIPVVFMARGSNNALNYPVSTTFASSEWVSPNSVIHAPARNAVVGGITYRSAVYDYGTAILRPVSTWQSEGYFVDLVFSSGSGSSYTGSVTEAASLDASVSAQLGATASITEAAARTDSATSLLQATAAVTEALSTGSTVSGTVQTTTAVSEALSLSDGVTAVVAVKPTITETLNPADAVSATTTVKPTITETLGLTDATDATRATTGAVTEGIALTDTADSALATSGDVTEAIGLGDAVQALGTGEAAVTEALALADSVYANVTAPPAHLEGITLTDSVTATVSTTADVAEALQLADLVTGVGSGDTALDITEALSLTDTVTASVSISVAITEAANLSEAMFVGTGHQAAVTEAINATALVSGRVAMAASVSEAVLLDTVQASGLFRQAAIAEALQLADLVTATVGTSHAGMNEDRIVFDGDWTRPVFTGQGKRQVFE